MANDDSQMSFTLPAYSTTQENAFGTSQTFTIFSDSLTFISKGTPISFTNPSITVSDLASSQAFAVPTWWTANPTLTVTPGALIS